MKRIIIWMLAATAFCACASEPGYLIRGKAGELNGKAVLAFQLPDGVSFGDTVAMRGGAFSFKGSVPDVLMGSIVLLPAGAEPLRASLYVENCPLSVAIDPSQVVDYAQYGGKVLTGVRVTGGPNNEFANVMEAARKAPDTMPQFRELAAALAEMQSLGYTDMAVYQQKQAEIQTKFAGQMTDYYGAVETAVKACVADHPGVEASAYLFAMYNRNLPLEEYEAGFDRFTDKVKESFLAKDAREEIYSRKATMPGAVAPDFTLNDPDGKPVALSSLRGRYVLVDFWASWCKPCRAGVPGLKELYKKYYPKGFEIIGVSDDSDHNAWKKAIEQDQSPWIHVVDEFPEANRPARVGQLYGIHYIPSYFLLDREGRIIGKMEHDELESKLAELLD